MTTTLKITGMSCMHCAGKVKAALEDIAGVTEANISLEEQSATVQSDSEISDAQFRTAVDATGYNYVGKA